MTVGLLQLAPRIDTLERATEEALFHRSPKQQRRIVRGDRCLTEREKAPGRTS
jgi:hypothetical protein